MDNKEELNVNGFPVETKDGKTVAIDEKGAGQVKVPQKDDKEVTVIGENQTLAGGSEPPKAVEERGRDQDQEVGR